MRSILMVTTALLLPVFFAAQAGEKMEPYVGSAEFEKIKKLAGTWSGTPSNAKAGEKVTVTYKVTSAGSSVVETLFPGMRHEMVSVYHDDNGKLSMTHYCSLRNQPTMSLQSSKKNKMSLSYSGGTNLDPAKDMHMHMHAMQFEIIDQNNIVHKWTQYDAGKATGVNTLALSRVK